MRLTTGCGLNDGKCSRGVNDHLFVKHWPVSVYRAPPVCGAGHADDLVDLQVPGNKADEVPCERMFCITDR